MAGACLERLELVDSVIRNNDLQVCSKSVAFKNASKKVRGG